MEGREVVQSTVIDAAFCIVGAALLMTAGGQTREYSYIFLLFTIVIETFVITISVVKSEDGISDLSGGGCVNKQNNGKDFGIRHLLHRHSQYDHTS